MPPQYTTIQDVVNGTPKGQEAVQKAIDDSIKVQNEMSKEAQAQEAERQAQLAEEQAQARAETPDADDDRKYQIGEKINDREVVAVSYTENEGVRSNYTYQLDDDSIVEEKDI